MRNRTIPEFNQFWGFRVNMCLLWILFLEVDRFLWNDQFSKIYPSHIILSLNPIAEVIQYILMILSFLYLFQEFLLFAFHLIYFCLLLLLNQFCLFLFCLHFFGELSIVRYLIVHVFNFFFAFDMVFHIVS